MTYVDLRPHHTREVQVLVEEETWVVGWLEAYQQLDGVWSGFVRYSRRIDRSGKSMTETYLGWFTEDRIRTPGNVGGG